MASNNSEESPVKQTKPEQVKEVSELKAEYGPECRVISDIGAFAHVIEVKFDKERDVSLKFQLEDTYPETAAHVMVKSRTLTTGEREQLALYLASFTEKHSGQLILKKTISQALEWLQETHPTEPTVTEGKHVESSYKPQRKLSPRSKQKLRQEKQLAAETENKKKPPMKTAMDVVSRILWDESLDKSDFTIGYLDRILGIVEKNFDAFSWEDVASVDYNTLAIPKHRIQYFRFKGITVWDKKIRQDDVFGSTGGKTITDVITEYNKAHNIDAAANSEPSGKYDDDYDSDDDGIEIDTGYDENKDNVVNAPWKQPEDPYWGPKKRPTHFLCLRITNPDIVEAVKKVDDLILDMEPSYRDCVIPSHRIHVTLACLGLDAPEDIENAIRALNKFKEELPKTTKPEEIIVNFNDIGNFFHSVLYAQVELNEEFLKFDEHLREFIESENVEIRDVFEFTPHMTLIKLKRQLGREVLHTRYLDQRLYTALNGSHFGSQILDNIHLCEMSEDRREDGFYISPGSISFP